MLIEKGLVRNKDPKTFFKEAVFAGSHDAGLQALLNGHVDAFASFDQAREQYLKDPAQREKLIWVAESAPIPEGGICARDGLDPELVAKVRTALLSMKGPAYAPILKALYDIDGFEPADDRDYDPVRAVEPPRRATALTAADGTDRRPGAGPPRPETAMIEGTGPASVRAPHGRPRRADSRVGAASSSRSSDQAGRARRPSSARSIVSSSRPPGRCAWPASRSPAPSPAPSVRSAVRSA
jgi:hypothetical protein